MSPWAPGRGTLRLLWKGHRFWWRPSGGRIGSKVAGLPVLELITTGRTSGRPRGVLLSFVGHPAGYVVIASNAGSERPPAWWRNLEATPRATVRRPRVRDAVTPRVLTGDERDRAWATAVAANPRFETYASIAEREIPVVLLERRRS